MNNFIDYFYKIKVTDIKCEKNYFSFIYCGYLYRLYIIDDNINVNQLLNINRLMVGKTLIDRIIENKFGDVISIYNNCKYMLVKVYAGCGKFITLEEISFLNNFLYTNKIVSNWGNLWSKKIDYLENLISEFGKQYPLIVDSFNYFAGMAENAIMYYNSINFNNNISYCINHKVININNPRESLYNPLNIIFDYKVRDLAEYIKNAFFLDNKNIYLEIDSYLKINNLTIIDVKLLISRIMYPSFYFELYEDILKYKKDEKVIINITDKLDSYEDYLANVIKYFREYYDIEEIKWLIKK